MEKTTIVVAYEKETKRNVRYKEITDENPAIGTVYIRKRALTEPYPEQLKITIEEV